MRPRKENLNPMLFIYPMLSAALCALCFLKSSYAFLIWICLIPLFSLLKNISWKKRWLCFFIFGVVFFCATIYWLIHVSLPGLICLCLYLGFELSLLGIFIKNPYHKYSLVCVPLLWIAFESLRGIFFGGFGWALLGYSQYKNLFLIQIADKAGVWGVSFLIVLINLALLQLLRMIKERRSLWPLPACIWVSILCLMFSFLYGAFRLNQPVAHPDLKISLIQANIPQEQKWDPRFAQSILERYRTLTLAAAKEKPDLIVWPESSVPGYLVDEPKLYKEITDLAKKIDCYLLVGSPREDYPTQTYYNSAFLFNNQGRLLRFYDKIHLVPFGEFIPYENIFWFLKNTPIADFSAGNDYTVFQLNNASLRKNFATLICFEDVFPRLVRRFREEEADFLITITNEAWFGKTSEPEQHLAISVFRAIENRCWFLRCANTGISCFIDPYGRIRKKVEKNNEDIFVKGIATMQLKP